jgi:hypothetical protein
MLAQGGILREFFRCLGMGTPTMGGCALEFVVVLLHLFASWLCLVHISRVIVSSVGSG